MHTVQNTLYVMTQHAYAHLENATLRIDVEHEKKLQVPLHHLGGLVCFGNVMVSPALMHRLADEGKSLVLLDDSGRFKARLEGPVSGNILLRRAHHSKASEPVFTLEFARAVVAGKLKNSRTNVQRGAREAADPIDPQRSPAAPTTSPPRCAQQPLPTPWTNCAAWKAKPRAVTLRRSISLSNR